MKAGLILLLAPISGGATLTVSPDGPLKTLTAARDKIRELCHSGDKAPMTVVVGGGTYFLDEPRILTPDDSGVTYVAAPGERAILSGGRRITGWTRKNNFQSLAPADFDFHQLFVGSRRAIRSRAPSQGYFRVVTLAAVMPKPAGMTRRDWIDASAVGPRGVAGPAGRGK